MRKSRKLAVGVLGVALALSAGYGVALASGVAGSGSPAVVSARAHSLTQGEPATAPTPPSPASDEASYVGITPCRIVDTRKGAGILEHDTSRSFQVTGSTGFAAQGGGSSGCAIPASATAVAITATSVSQSGRGYLDVYPAGSASIPLASQLTFSPGVIISGLINATIGTNGEISVYAGSSDTQLVVDVNGYYAPKIEGMISPDGSIFSGTSRLVSASYEGAGVFHVIIDTDVSYCTPTVDPFSGYMYAAAYTLAGDEVTVNTWQLDQTTHLETPVDGSFYLTVTC